MEMGDNLFRGRKDAIQEELLYFIWQFQYLTTRHLTTTDGEQVEVVQPGYRNGNAGPDFLNARLLIDGVEWVGTVEAHVKTSDWLLHRHQTDRSYDNVILHIVWQHDRIVARPDGTRLPTLEIGPLTPAIVLSKHQQLMHGTDPIPCAGQLRLVKPLRQTAMLDTAMLQRLERKANAVKEIYVGCGQDWEETTYRLLATYLGAKVNAQPMEQLARAVPLRVLQKHRNSLLQIESLLFGRAGLLPEAEADEAEYLSMLRREYHFLSAKFSGEENQLPAHNWKWGRLRPAGFPTMRLAQLAQLIHSHGSLFDLMVNYTNVPELLTSLQLQPSGYWQTHYRFGKTAGKATASLGEATAQGLLLNVAAPLMAAYASHKARPELLDKALEMLELLPAEDNRITRLWDILGLTVRSAFDSQASIELYTEFCLPKRCLSCQIGVALVR